MEQEKVDALIRTLLALGGGALAVSLVLFLRSESLELDAGLVAALQLAWLALFYVLGAGTAVRFLALFGPPTRVRRLLNRLLVGTASVALLLGLALLAYVSAVALADANAEDTSQERDTSAI